MPAVLEVDDLTTRFATPDGEVAAVSNVGFRIGKRESVGVVGESGSGKTQAFLSIMGLLAKNGRCTGSARFLGQELLNLPARELNRIRGVRCTICWNVDTARLARQHNDANVLSIGARLVREPDLLPIVTTWLTTPFEGGRHARRIAEIDSP